MARVEEIVKRRKSVSIRRESRWVTGDGVAGRESTLLSSNLSHQFQWSRWSVKSFVSRTGP